MYWNIGLDNDNIKILYVISSWSFGRTLLIVRSYVSVVRSYGRSYVRSYVRSCAWHVPSHHVCSSDLSNWAKLYIYLLVSKDVFYMKWHPWTDVTCNLRERFRVVKVISKAKDQNGVSVLSEWLSHLAKSTANWKQHPHTCHNILLIWGVNIGFATALKLLRMGATVAVTTRFPKDCLRRYSQEEDRDQVSFVLETRRFPKQCVHTEGFLR